MSGAIRQVRIHIQQLDGLIRKTAKHIFVGDGKGKFTRWPITFTQAGKDKPERSIDYGGVAVADIDGDGHADVASASHNGGLATFFGDGKGGFEVVREGLPKRDFSSQAVVLLDANRDKRLDLVASRDVVEVVKGQPVDKQQVPGSFTTGSSGASTRTA